MQVKSLERQESENPSKAPTTSETFVDLIDFLGPVPSAQHILDQDDSLASRISYEIMNPASIWSPRPSNDHNMMDTDDSVQYCDEITSRTYHNTMRQLAPRGDRKMVKTMAAESIAAFPDPTPIFLNDVNVATRSILGTMQNWQGTVTLQAQFGRIFFCDVQTRYVAEGSRATESYSKDVLRKYLDSATSLPGVIHFTEILTTLPADVQFVIDIEDDNEKRIWKSSVRENWLIVYEFYCQDTVSNRHFMLEIDGETFACSIKELPHQIGHVYVHCTTRNWDYRIAAVGQKLIDDAYNVFAENLLKDLYVP